MVKKYPVHLRNQQTLQGHPQGIVIMCDEKKTSRNMYFVSIHNSLYTQCRGAPIKKSLFFSETFFNIFLKSHIFFLKKTKKALYMNKQHQNSFSWAVSEQPSRSNSFHLWSKNKNNKHWKKKTRPAACCYLGHYVTQTTSHI